MKRYIVLFLAILLILGATCPAVSAVSAEKAIFDLKGLGVITEEESSLDLSEKVTRAEFAQMTVRLLGLDGMTENLTAETFWDVDASMPCAGAVETLAALGIIAGDSGEGFSPAANISLQQAVKILVISLGYGREALSKGGWPLGYVSVAAQLNLLKDIKTEIDRRGVFTLLYNALDVKLLLEVYAGDEFIITEETLRMRLATKTNHEVYKGRGVINANSFAYAGTPVPNLRADEVVIDSVIYQTGTAEVFDLLGMEVDFYTVETDGGYRLISIKPTAKNTVTVIEAEDIAGRIGNTISYSNNETGSMQTLTVPADARVVYNSARVFNPVNTVYDITNGSITAIDNNGDGKEDVILIDEYVNAMAASFENNQFIFQSGYEYAGKSRLFIDTDDKDIQMRITDINGALISEIAKNSVVSIFVNLDGTRYKIIVSEQTVQGRLEEIGDTYIMIDSEQYEIETGRIFADVRFGISATAYLDYKGRVAYIEYTEDKVNYGYIVSFGQENALSKTMVKLLQANTVDFGVIVNEDDLDDTDQIPYLFAVNKGLEVFPLAYKVRYEGKFYTGRELSDLLYLQKLKTVSYTLNKEGEISELDAADFYGGDFISRCKYNVYEKVFGGSQYIDGFAIDEQTRVICIPDQAQSDEDYFVTVEINLSNNNVGYMVSAFDLDKQTKKAKLLVINAAMDSAQVRNVSLETSRISFVCNNKKVYDAETDNISRLVTILKDSETQTLKVMPSRTESALLTELRSGDLITYLTNTNGELENVWTARSFAKEMGETRLPSAMNDYVETCGTVVALDTDEVDSLNYKLVCRIILSVNGLEYPFYIPQRNMPPVYTYNLAGQIAEPSKLADIRVGDKVYILERTADSTIRVCVLVR